MNKKSLRIILIPLVLILVLITVLYGSKIEITTCIYKNKTGIDDVSSFGFKMYSNNEINSNIERRSFQQTNGAKLLNDSIVKVYKAKYTTETTTSYACIIPFISPIRFNSKVNFSWSINDKTGIIKSDTDKFMIQGKLKFFGYKSKGNCQRLIRQNISRQAEEEIKKIMKLKMEELKY